MADPTAVAGYAIGPNGSPVALQQHQLEDVQNTAPSTQYISGPVARALESGRQDNQYVDQNYGTAGKFAAGVGSGLTLGLGPAAASYMGLIDPRHLEALENSGAYTAGDLAGTIVPGLLTGGESVAARGALGEGAGIISKALRYGTPAGLMGGAGTGAERLAGKFLSEAGILGKGASSTIQMAARGATEGAIINAAHQASQDIIYNKPLAAQSLLAAGADGALFGGLVGGLMGGASAALSSGVDIVGGRVASAAGGKGEAAAAKALKHMGQTDARLAAIRAEEGSVIPHLRAIQEVLTDGEGSIATNASEINAVAKKQAGHYETIAKDAIGQLQHEAPTMTPKFQRVEARMTKDVAAQFEGTYGQARAENILNDVKDSLGGKYVRGPKPEAPVAPKAPGPGAPKGGLDWGDYRSDLAKFESGPLAEYEASLEVWKSSPGTRQGGFRNWKNWADSREMLADEASKASGTDAQVYKTVLNAFDSELRTAMDAANPDLAAAYGSAVSSRRIAEELADMSGKKAVADVSRGDIAMNGYDFGNLAFAAMGGHLLTGAGYVAGKKVIQHLAGKLEPVMAEYAARSALGAQAGAAQATMRSKVQGTMRKFLTGARQGASEVKATRPNFTMKGYAEALQVADDLTSAAHQTKVRETMNALSAAGHPDLAQEMGMTYGRAVAYVNATKPKGRSKETDAGRLGKPPKDAGITTDGMKFLNRLHAMRDPIGALMGGLENGNISSDAVKAVKYVMPDVHSEIVMIASQEIMTMKQEGKFVPADKIALLGTALDAQVDTTLAPDFIAEIQKGHAANNATPPDNNSQPQQNTDVSSYQTPLQSSVG